MSDETQLTAEQIAERKAAYLAKRNRINAEVSALIRSPFQRIIADYLACAPSAESIKSFADKYPDRYAAALAQIAPLAGYQKEINVQSTNIHLVGNLADSTLTARLQAAEQRLIELQQKRLIIENPSASHQIAPGQAATIHQAISTTQDQQTTPTTTDNSNQAQSIDANHDTEHERQNHGDSQACETHGEIHTAERETLSHSVSFTESTPFQARSSADDASIIDVTMRVIDGAE